MAPAPWRNQRIALVGLTAILVLSACAAGLGGEKGPVSIHDSACWTCHASATPPLRVPTIVIPLAGRSAAVGETLSASLRVQDGWLQEVRHLDLGIDISGAPSLALQSSTPPLSINETFTLHPDPTQPMATTAHEVAVNLSAGPTSSRILVTPSDTDSSTGPRLVAVISYPGGKVVRFPASARGQPIDLSNILVSIVGPVRLRIELPGLGASVENLTAYRPPASDVAVRVAVAAGFDLTNVRQAKFGIPFLVDRTKAATLSGLNFTLLQPPVKGEQVIFTLNSTVYYNHHIQPGTGNWGNWTQDTVAVAVRPLGTDRAVFEGVVIDPGARPVPVNGPTMTTVGEAVGYSASFLIVSSISSGGMFGKASRRGMNNLFGSAKRRVAFHNVLSYGLILAALVHMVLFFLDADYKWTRGILFGGGGILAMLGLGVTGALQVPMIRKWSYTSWRWTHYGLAAAVIALTIGHLLLEGTHFGTVQESLHYSDPFQRA